MRRKRISRGMSIIEVLVCISVLTVMISLVGTTAYFYQTRSSGLTRCANDMKLAITAGEKWREDVRSCDGPPALEDGALRLPRRKGTVVYRFADGQVQMQHEQDAEWRPVLRNVLASAMVKDRGQHVESWRWELELKGSSKAPAVRPLFTFKAVPGRAGEGGGPHAGR